MSRKNDGERTFKKGMADRGALTTPPAEGTGKFVMESGRFDIRNSKNELVAHISIETNRAGKQRVVVSDVLSGTNIKSVEVRESKVGTIACRHFQKGFCKLGDKCKFLHATDAAEPKEAEVFGIRAKMQKLGIKSDLREKLDVTPRHSDKMVKDAALKKKYEESLLAEITEEDEMRMATDCGCDQLEFTMEDEYDSEDGPHLEDNDAMSSSSKAKTEESQETEKWGDEGMKSPGPTRPFVSAVAKKGHNLATDAEEWEHMPNLLAAVVSDDKDIKARVGRGGCINVVYSGENWPSGDGPAQSSEYNIWARGTKVVCTPRSSTKSGKVPKDSKPWSKMTASEARDLVHNPPIEKCPETWACMVVDRILNFMQNIE